MDSLEFQVLKSDFVKTAISLKELIQEIRECCGSQNDIDELGVLVRSKIGQLKDQIDAVEIIVQVQDKPDARQILDAELQNWKKQLHDYHIIFRNVLLAAQLTINQRDKDELLGTSRNDNKNNEASIRQREKMSKKLLIKKSSQLTDDLLTVTRMIRDNTEKSTKTLDTLVESSQTVTSTQEELKTMGSVIGQAKKILNKYGRRETTDKLLILLGLIFFLASCLVVIRNRFIF